MTSTLDCMVISPLPLLELRLSSSCLKILNDSEGMVGLVPLPLHTEQVLPVDSRTEFISLCLDNSNKPNLEIDPIWTRALSLAVAFSISFSIEVLFASDAISMKSITTRPPISRSCNCKAISSAASKLAL